MEAFYKKGDGLSPEIVFDPEKNQFTISGKSIPIEPDQFFMDAIAWLKRYSESPNDITQLKINLKYLNATSSRSFIDILNEMKEIDRRGKAVSIEWTVPPEADDLHELSEDILQNSSLPHQIISSN